MKEYNNYEVINEKTIEELSSNASLLVHKKTGAHVLLLENDDDNKVFTIGFRTPPTDDTGLPHILEHSTLCGSKKFPVKEPFVELLKGSLNTFLNAMTYPDKTVYPVASCNEQDFKNLMDVYMDAVFYPNVQSKEEIFRQEGWHYELENKDADIKLNGVVYNEMKGAFSSPEQVVMRASMHALYPDSSYGVESGGDPDFIPELSYEDFKAFHKKYYHPSNSYIVLYGNMNMEERLAWMDKEYLSKFDKINIDSEIKMQKAFSKSVDYTLEYPVSKDDSIKDKTYFSYNAVIGSAFDNDLVLAFQILSYILLDAPGAPLKQVLLDAHAGKDVFGSYESGILQPMISIIAKDSNEEEKENFVNTIEKTLKELVKNGLDKKALKSAINFYEFKYRESDFQGTPKGLVFSLNAFDSWLYDEEEPFIRLETNKAFDFLKAKVETNYFEELIVKYLINNPHKALVTVKPSNTLGQVKEKALKEKLAKLKASLSDEEIEKLVKATSDLKAYQSAPSTKEELDTIPMLTRKDIEDKVEPLSNLEYSIANTKVIQHDFFTNGIGYLTMSFDTKGVPDDLIPYLGILTSVLGSVDTKKHTYQDLFQEINIYTGGITTDMVTLPKEKNDLYAGFTFSARVLFDKVSYAFNFIKEIITESIIDSKKRLYEIIAENKSRRSMSLMSVGHIAALTRASSYIKSSAYYRDLVDGITQYQLVEKLEANYDDLYQDLVNKLNELINMVFTKENLIISYTANAEGFKLIESLIPSFVNDLYEHHSNHEFNFKPQLLNEGFKTPSQVQYVARVGNYTYDGFKYTGALRVFKMALSYDYLWLNIRVKGGAYGALCSFSQNGDMVLVSYRDPELKATNDVYNKIPEFIDDFNPTEDELTKYIIGAIGELDSPLHPSMKGKRSFSSYLAGISLLDLKRERKEVLNVTTKDIKALKELIVDSLKQNAFCVIGNDNKIEENKDLFKEVSNLFK